MLGYVTIGANDFEAQTKFYDAIAAAVGAKRAMDFPDFIIWANGKPGGMLALAKPNNKQAATVGNGWMAALNAEDKAQVDSLHALALSLGGTCEGPPGPRSDNFYAAYFRDPEGNKLAAFHMS